MSLDKVTDVLPSDTVSFSKVHQVCYILVALSSVERVFVEAQEIIEYGYYVSMSICREA